MGPKVEETLACVSWICSIPELIGTKAGLRAAIFSYFKKIVALKPSIKKGKKHNSRNAVSYSPVFPNSQEQEVLPNTPPVHTACWSSPPLLIYLEMENIS